MAKLRLNPALIQKITNLIKKGNTARASAVACGITEVTFYDWLNKGEKEPKGIFHDFYEAVQVAQALPEVNVVGRLYEKAMDGDVRAIDIFLSRRYRKDWAAQQRIEVSGAVQMDLEGFRAKLEERIAKEAGNE